MGVGQDLAEEFQIKNQTLAVTVGTHAGHDVFDAGGRVFFEDVAEWKPADILTIRCRFAVNGRSWLRLGPSGFVKHVSLQLPGDGCPFRGIAREGGDIKI
jgi:hypothetical protein